MVNPPVPVQVNPLRIAICKTVPESMNTILLDPNATERVFVLLETKLATVKSYPFNFSEPAVNVVAVYRGCDKALSNDHSPAELLKVIFELI